MAALPLSLVMCAPAPVLERRHAAAWPRRTPRHAVHRFLLVALHWHGHGAAWSSGAVMPVSRATTRTGSQNYGLRSCS